MSAWDFFQRKASLTVNPSEWEKGCAEFERVGLRDVWKYQAIEVGSAPEIKGVHQSFNATMRASLQGFWDSDAQTLLHMEDDCWFQEFGHLEAALSQLPSDWDLVYLGANLLCWNREDDPRPLRFSEHLFRIGQAWTTHCVGFNRKVIPFLLENQPPFSEMMLDQFLSNSLPSLNAFVVGPLVCWQRPHFSSIWDRMTDYTDIFEASNRLLI